MLGGTWSLAERWGRVCQQRLLRTQNRKERELARGKAPPQAGRWEAPEVRVGGGTPRGVWVLVQVC